jgi:hypothetical protein
VLWLAGEQHRSNCQDAGKVGCSVLPWSGSTRPDVPLTSADPCETLQAARALMGRPAGTC